MTLFDYVLEKASQGKKVRLDLKNGTLKLGSKTIIDKCKFDTEYLSKNSITDVLPNELIDNPKENIEKFYKEFSTSIRTKESIKEELYGYFEPLKVNELSIQNMLDGGNRVQAKIKLELYVLCCKMIGNFKFDDDKHYFWKSKKYKKLIVLKEWVTC